MDVSSALEIYTLVLGWVLYDGLWKILADTGLVYIPLVAAILKNFFFAWRVQGDEGAETTLRNNWMDILAMMTVIAVAGMPMFTVKLSDLSYVTPCGGNTVTGGSTGTLYDNAFAAINGKTAQVPLWWTMLLSIANGINGAAVALIPCSPDLRTFAYRIDNARITDPELRRQLELFTGDCWQKARAKFITSHTALPASYPPDDLDWIGSQYFQDTDGYYGNANLNLSIRASEELPGFPYNAARDTEYLPGFIPAWGRPECNDWWNNATSGIMPRLMALIDSAAITQATIETGDIELAKNVLLRKLIAPEQAALGRNLAINSYQNNYNANAGNIAQGAAGVGLAVELASWIPKIYALRQAAPVGQSFILMGIYTFLPFILLFSAYSTEVLYTVTAAIFGIKFLTPIWTLAVWIDNHMMEGLGIKWYSWMSFQEDKATTMVILNLVAMLMFVVLPILWFAVIGWSGFALHKTMDTFKIINSPVENGTNTATNIATGMASKGAGKLLK